MSASVRQRPPIPASGGGGLDNLDLTFFQPAWPGFADEAEPSLLCGGPQVPGSLFPLVRLTRETRRCPGILGIRIPHQGVRRDDAPERPAQLMKSSEIHFTVYDEDLLKIQPAPQLAPSLAVRRDNAHLDVQQPAARGV